MRSSWMGTAAFAAALALSGTACAGGPELRVTEPQALPPPVDDSGEIVPMVSPGDEISIDCESLDMHAPDSDVRVVLTISATPGETGPGYKKVLATDEELMRGAVKVRIPNTPDLMDHTVDLNVYVVNASGSQTCNAGHLKITQTLPLPRKHA
jgi:hypothetical protein